MFTIPEALKIIDVVINGELISDTIFMTMLLASIFLLHV